MILKEQQSSNQKLARRGHAKCLSTTAGDSHGNGSSSKSSGIPMKPQYTSDLKIKTRAILDDNINVSMSVPPTLFNRNLTLNYPAKDDYSEVDSSSTDSDKEKEKVSSRNKNRLIFRISERLRYFLEYDYDMIMKFRRQHALPSRMPVIAILENFVKQNAVKLAFSTQTTDIFRRRCTQQSDKKEKEFNNLVKTVGLLKEVADGLRIYFDFTVTDYLLYKVERDYALSYLSEEYLKNFQLEMQGAAKPKKSNGEEESKEDDSKKKKQIRSYQKADDCSDIVFVNISSLASESSEASAPASWTISSSNIDYLKSLPLAYCVTTQTKDFLQDVLAWKLLPSNAPAAPSMIFGASHLARLIVKLPEFLNASSISDEKLKVLVGHLESFTNFLEGRKDWFDEENYEPLFSPVEKYDNFDNFAVFCKRYDKTDVSMSMKMDIDAVSMDIGKSTNVKEPSTSSAPKQSIAT